MAGNTSLPDSPLIGKRTTVIRVAGIPQKATLFDGTVVHRREIVEFWMGEVWKRVKAAPYDNHFCYLTPDHILGWTLMCTCGGMAGVVGYDQYKGQASPSTGGLISGELLVCLNHTENQRHVDGSS